MAEIINRNIDNNEIIIRFIFKGDIKVNKQNKKENIIDKDVFIDTRNPEVSLLREKYNSKDDCVKRGYDVKSDFIGFVIFKKNDYDNCVNSHKNDCATFNAEIVSSPLDADYNIIPLEIEVRTDTPINPGHSDLKYINPGLIQDDENPNIAIRRFSRKLFKICHVCFENENFEEIVEGIKVI
ncbi:hypothetical protein [uncultured Flavobacterium sp.]|uniref:hypothetical protein n=1 Tax=uncultured Flavobacterium sp. TaxID=165435 RepID=UPI0030EB9469|tara:strand:+ start:41531 stop:42076 length:546 start_codon:yes stop_codon:yes gene_type:complete